MSLVAGRRVARTVDVMYYGAGSGGTARARLVYEFPGNCRVLGERLMPFALGEAVYALPVYLARCGPSTRLVAPARVSIEGKPGAWSIRFPAMNKTVRSLRDLQRIWEARQAERARVAEEYKRRAEAEAWAKRVGAWVYTWKKGETSWILCFKRYGSRGQTCVPVQRKVSIPGKAVNVRLLTGIPVFGSVIYSTKHPGEVLAEAGPVERWVKRLGLQDRVNRLISEASQAGATQATTPAPSTVHAPAEQPGKASKVVAPKPRPKPPRARGPRFRLPEILIKRVIRRTEPGKHKLVEVKGNIVCINGECKPYKAGELARLVSDCVKTGPTTWLCPE